jgi:hypothetical protein
MLVQNGIFNACNSFSFLAVPICRMTFSDEFYLIHGKRGADLYLFMGRSGMGFNSYKHGNIVKKEGKILHQNFVNSASRSLKSGEILALSPLLYHASSQTLLSFA